MQIIHQSPSSLPPLNGSFVASCQGGGPQNYVTQAGHIALERTVHVSLCQPQQGYYGELVDSVSAAPLFASLGGREHNSCIICQHSKTGQK